MRKRKGRLKTIRSTVHLRSTHALLRVFWSCIWYFLLFGVSASLPYNRTKLVTKHLLLSILNRNGFRVITFCSASMLHFLHFWYVDCFLIVWYIVVGRSSNKNTFCYCYYTHTHSDNNSYCFILIILIILFYCDDKKLYAMILPIWTFLKLKNANRSDPRIRFTLGFLYLGYRRERWW